MKWPLMVVFSLAIIAAVVGFSLIMAFSLEDKAGSDHEISGEVSAVDLGDSAILIRQLTDEKKDFYEEASVYVTKDSAIEKNGEPASLANVLIGDGIRVEYTLDGEGRKIANYILVETKDSSVRSANPSP